jgi:hypothetical protein
MLEYYHNKLIDCNVRQCLTIYSMNLYESRIRSIPLILFAGFDDMTNEDNSVEFDSRLRLPLDFVCKILDVSTKDFVSLALSNLIDEELDWINNNGFDADFKEIKGYKKIVDSVKFEADGWVINRK